MSNCTIVNKLMTYLAAPDLLATTQALIHYLDTCCDEEDFDSDTVNNARALVSRLTGDARRRNEANVRWSESQQ
jgi:hypothetical protein